MRHHHREQRTGRTLLADLHRLDRYADAISTICLTASTTPLATKGLGVP